MAQGRETLDDIVQTKHEPPVIESRGQGGKRCSEKNRKTRQ